MERRLIFSVSTQRLVGDLHLPDGSAGPFPCVVTSHGYKSNRGSEKYIQIGYRFPLEGIAVLRFDHRGALDGESDGAFEDTTLSGRVQDLLAAIEALNTAPELDTRRLGLFGSSLGGMDALLVKSEFVRARVAVSTPFTFPRPTETVRTTLAEKGYLEYPDGTRIKKEFYDDLGRYDLKEEIKQVRCPLLVIHGDLDEVVPRHHARVLYQSAGSEIKDLKMIEGGDHAFTDLDRANEVLSLALDWFKKYL